MTGIRSGRRASSSPTQFDSFFDVFVDIDLSGIHLFNDQPIRVQRHAQHAAAAKHAHGEPGSRPMCSCTDVSDPPPGGQPRAEIEYVDHNVNPEFPPGADDSFNTTLTATLQLFPPFPSLHQHGDRGRRDPHPPERSVPRLWTRRTGHDPDRDAQLSLAGTDPFARPLLHRRQPRSGLSALAGPGHQGRRPG